MEYRLRRTLLLMLIIACGCLIAGAQNNGGIPPPDGVYPSNSWDIDPQRWHYFPDDVAQFDYCTYEKRNGFKVLIGGVPFVMKVQSTTEANTVKTGGHVHEQYTGTNQPSIPRPMARVLNLSNTLIGRIIPNTYFGVTDSTNVNYGCARIQVQLAGISGMNTFRFDAPLTEPTTGINYFAEVYSQGGARSGAYFEPYPDDATINQPQDFPLPDSDRHVGGPIFVDVNALPSFRAFSLQYLTQSQSVTGNLADRIKLTRCSVEFGGIADNDKTGLAPFAAASFEWSARYNEGHEFGNECDATNPSLNKPQPVAAQLQEALRQTFINSSCVLSALAPDGLFLGSSYNQLQAYWSTSDKFHFTCGARPAPATGRGSGVGGK